MTSFLSIGECMVEFAPAGDGRFAMSFAGDTFNTAWYLSRILGPGHSIAYASAIGTDAISDAMLAFMDDAGLDTTPIQRDPSRTVGLYLIQLTKGERSFSYWRSDSAARHLAQDPDRLRASLAGRDVIYFSGITLAILPEADRAGFLDALAVAAGAEIVFDPNLRPRLWPDTVTMCDWVERAAAIADTVLPSFEDEAVHFGDASPAATADRYGRASRTVIVKNGAGSILVRHDGGTSEVAVDAVKDIVDTTAAGDSFNAGYLAARAAGASPDDAAAEGARLAAKVVQGRGALVAV